MTQVSYQLLLNETPVQAQTLSDGSSPMDYLQAVEVEEHTDIASILQLRFSTAVRGDQSGWRVLDDELFTRLANLRLAVSVGNNPPQDLIDAFVVQVRASFANQPGESTIEVIALDATAQMSLEDKIRVWEDISDSDIATSIFSEYGFTPQVESTNTVHDADGAPVVQRGTDIAFLKELASRNGFECYVERNPQAGVTEGHFHPPRLDGTPQDALRINMGNDTNLSQFAVQHAFLAPMTATTRGIVSEDGAEQDGTADTPALTTMGASPTLNGSARTALPRNDALFDAAELQTYAQALVDRAALSIQAEGVVDLVNYGALLRARRPVDVVGAGAQYSGTYYVERVLTSLGGDLPTQQFTLVRNATGTSGLI